MGRSHDPDVHGYRAAAADPFHPPLLDDAQDLSLAGQGHVADLVKENRSPIGLFDFADALLHPGGHAFFDAEHLAFKDGLGNNRAVQGQKRSVAPAAVVMDGFRDQFFSGSGFAGDQDIHRRIRNLADTFEQFLDRRAGAEDADGTEGFLEGLLQAEVFPGEVLSGGGKLCLDGLHLRDDFVEPVFPCFKLNHHHAEGLGELGNHGRVELALREFEKPGHIPVLAAGDLFAQQDKMAEKGFPGFGRHFFRPGSGSASSLSIAGKSAPGTIWPSMMK